eukprot:m.54383 g.54383  ORF g.54383 m.54383 type:complete len:411 (+) comp10922_c0_seq4:281-1513(+)
MPSKKKKNKGKINVSKLMEMGFDETKCKDALWKTDGDLSDAIALLLSSDPSHTIGEEQQTPIFESTNLPPSNSSPEMLLSFLKNCFPESSEELTQYMEAHQGNVTSIVDELLTRGLLAEDNIGENDVYANQGPSSKNQNPPKPSLLNIMAEEAARKEEEELCDISSVYGGEALVRELQSEFPDIDVVIIKGVLAQCHGNVAKVREFFQGPEKRDQNGGFQVVKRKNRQSRQPNFPMPGSNEEQEPPPNDTKTALPDLAELHAQVNEHTRLRNKCFRRAAKGYADSRHDEVDQYSKEGRMHDRRIKELNHQVVQAIVALRTRNGNSSEDLDLHGFHVEEALDLAEKILDMHKVARQRAGFYPHKTQKIITGVGKHSQGKYGRLKHALKTYLDDKGYRYVTIQGGGCYEVFI